MHNRSEYKCMHNSSEYKHIHNSYEQAYISCIKSNTLYEWFIFVAGDGQVNMHEFETEWPAVRIDLYNILLDVDIHYVIQTERPTVRFVFAIYC